MERVKGIEPLVPVKNDGLLEEPLTTFLMAQSSAPARWSNSLLPLNLDIVSPRKN